MKHEKLFNPASGEEFEVGKDIKYITDFEYIPSEYKILNEFFSNLANGKNKEVYRNMFELMDEISFRIYRNLIWSDNDYILNKDFIQDFIKVLNGFVVELENDSNIRNDILSKLKTISINLDGKQEEKLLDILTKHNIDFISEITKSLKNIIKDIEKKSTQFILNKKEIKDIVDLYTELGRKIKQQENWNISEIFSLYSELINKSKFNTLLRFFSKYISDISDTPFGDWRNENNIYSKIIRNDIINKLKGKKININYEKLEQDLSQIINNFVAFKILKNDEKYFIDKERYEKWHLLKNHILRLLNENKNELFTNMSAWKYLNPEFLKQFKSFDDFIENSGIKKDAEGFSLLYYFGMMYGYDNGLVDFTGDRYSFSDKLLSQIPIWKQHIKDYIGRKHLFLYKLTPNAIDEKNAYYSPDKLIKFLNVANKNSCIRNRILDTYSKTPIERLAISKSVNFIIIADKDGNTIGRFVDYNNDMFSNIYYDGKAYDDAFEKGGREIISSYLLQKNKNKKDFTLSYSNRTRLKKNNELAKIENNIKRKLKDYWKFFYLNDIIIAKRKK
ncbi:MAG: hypothetical protein QW230_04185 [Thermofilum sp.]